MKIAFLGTPLLAVDFLKTAAKSAEVVLVATQPDRPSGRGMKVSPSPIKEYACGAGFNVVSPVSKSELAQAIGAARADLGVVVAFGRILDKQILDSTRLGFINLHFSLLPLYRGAAPVQWSLINGETRTGVTSFWLDEGMDTGPVFLQKECAIAGDDDAAALFGKLGAAGQEVLSETLARVAEGRIEKNPQEGRPSCAPLLETKDSFLDFDKPAAGVHNKVRGLVLGPAARIVCPASGGQLQVLKTSLAGSRAGVFGPAGSIVRVERGKGFYVQCIDREILVESVRPEGKKLMPAADFLNGFKLKAGDLLCSKNIYDQ